MADVELSSQKPAHDGHGHDHRHEHRHGHVHGHGLSHGHHHHHAGSHGLAFGVAIALNSLFVVAEAVAAFFSGSAALLADAGHNLSDVLSLLLAWGASRLATRPASDGYTFGLKSSSILAAIANAALLFITLGAVLLETVQRFFAPQPVKGGMMMAVAAAGIGINLVSALLFARGSRSDLNLRAAFLHLMADAAVSASVVVAGLVIVLTRLEWIDPVVSLIITVGLAVASWDLLKDAIKMGLLAVPRHIDETAVRGFLTSCPGVTAVHDLHIWGMSTTETASTVHLVMPGGWPGDAAIKAIARQLEERFNIHHATIQVETGSDDCGAGC